MSNTATEAPRRNGVDVASPAGSVDVARLFGSTTTLTMISGTWSARVATARCVLSRSRR